MLYFIRVYEFGLQVMQLCLLSFKQFLMINVFLVISSNQILYALLIPLSILFNVISYLGIYLFHNVVNCICGSKKKEATISENGASESPGAGERSKSLRKSGVSLDMLPNSSISATVSDGEGQALREEN